MAAVDGEVGAFEELVAMEQKWAAHARQQGVITQKLAERDAAGGDLVAERLHRRQALAYQRAATTHERTAELYRRRIAWLVGAHPAAGDAR